MQQYIWPALAMVGGGVGMYMLRGIPQFLWSTVRRIFIFSVKVYQYDELFDILEKYMAKHYTVQYKDVEACLIQTTENLVQNRVSPSGGTFRISTPTSIFQSIRYKQETNTFIIKYMGKRLVISKSKEKLDHVQNIKDLYFSRFIISGWRAKVAIEHLISEALEFSKIDPDLNTIKVHSSNNWGEWEMGSPTKIKPLSKVILAPTVKDLVIDDITAFTQSEQWYVDRAIPYKRGYLLHGPPGTGKTTLALSLSHMLGRNVRCLNLNNLSDDGRVVAAFRNMPDNSILLIEDIDKVFSGRDNVNKDCKVSFSSFINCLDGAFYKHGIITIITTNYIDKLDEALLRTGRIDLKVEIPLPTSLEISQFLSLFYGEDIKVKGSYNVTMSDIQEICLRNRNSPNITKIELEDLLKLKPVCQD